MIALKGERENYLTATNRPSSSLSERDGLSRVRVRIKQLDSWLADNYFCIE